MNNIVIYSRQKSNRLDYVLEFLNNQYSNLELINRIDEHISGDYFIVSSEDDSGLQLNIPNSGLVLDTGIQNSFEDFAEHLMFNEQSFSFDFLSAIFFLLSRSEEYNSSALDKHHRFQYQASELYKKQLLEKPIIDYWINDLLQILNEQFGLNATRTQGYYFQSTLDIDHISAYKHKGFGIFVGGMIRDIIKGRWRKVSARFWKKDPFDTYDEIVAKHNELDLDLKVFILCASRSKFDKSLPPENKEFIYKVQRLSDKFEIGIHPSYKSDSKFERIDNEIKLLESIVAKPIKSSRFHYIRIKWPESYKVLLAAGIKDDFSMGYPDALGFRAGTSLPFYWYDLEKEEQTELRIHPFQIMDVTMRKYLNLDAQQAIKKASEIIKTIKEAGGCCCILWHNSSFFGLEGWAGWRETYDQLLQKAKA